MYPLPYGTRKNIPGCKKKKKNSYPLVWRLISSFWKQAWNARVFNAVPLQSRRGVKLVRGLSSRSRHRLVQFVLFSFLASSLIGTFLQYFCKIVTIAGLQKKKILPFNFCYKINVFHQIRFHTHFRCQHKLVFLFRLVRYVK